jgi:hypothetical protein
MSEDQQQQQPEQPEQPDAGDLQAMFKGFSDAVMEQVEARLKATTQPTTTEPETPASTLTQRIAQLEKQLAEKAELEAKTARQQNYDNSFKAELTRYQLAFPVETENIVKGLMASDMDLVEGKWLSKDGKTLQERVDAFFATPFGQHLLKAPTGQFGTGTQPSQQPRQQNTGNTQDAVKRLFGLG